MQTLIESKVKYVLNDALQKCHETKVAFYNMIYTIILSIIIIGGFSLILWVKYKGKLTPLQKQQKDEQSRQQILETLQRCLKQDTINMQSMQTNEYNLISNLPLPAWHQLDNVPLKPLLPL